MGASPEDFDALWAAPKKPMTLVNTGRNLALNRSFNDSSNAHITLYTDGKQSSLLDLQRNALDHFFNLREILNISNQEA